MFCCKTMSGTESFYIILLDRLFSIFLKMCAISSLPVGKAYPHLSLNKRRGKWKNRSHSVFYKSHEVIVGPLM